MFLIGNGIVVTRDRKDTFIKNGAVCMKDQFIYEVGPLDELQKKYNTAEFIDAHGGIIMPGLINTHNHSYSAFARGLSIPDNHPSDFLSILEGTWWKLDRKLTLEQVYLSAKATYVDCIKNGVTTVFDHHASYGNIRGSLFQIAKAAEELGVRSCLAYEISDRDGEDKKQQAIDENFDFIEACNKDTTGMLKAMIGMHASFTLSDTTLDYCVERNQGKNGFHIHAAEGIQDALHCQETYHMSIVERLYKKGILGDKTIAAHCVHINDRDLELLKATNTSVVHNPESNMGNAVGCPDILNMYQKGIRTGLGTDGYTNDLLESMKVANLLQKHNSKNPSAAWTEIPEMVFKNNNKIAAGVFGHPVGMLEKGAWGDVIIVEYDPLTPIDINNINSHILFGMNGKNTITTIINGKPLMKDRKLIHADETELMGLCRDEAGKLWKDLCS
ncbi:MAG: putative aminohydrolase SsnA [Anaerocolumna sp.]